MDIHSTIIIIAKSGNHPNDKSNVVYTMKYNSTIKKNEVLKHTTAWINLENNVLSERSQIINYIYTE